MNTDVKICPICNGTGIYKEPPLNLDSRAGFIEHTCHGCNGKGWIVIDNKEDKGIGDWM